MGRLSGKVALVTGAARGQGRSHVLTMAREGADIVALDLAADLDGVPYGMATAAEMEQLVADVEALGRKIVARNGDVRSQDDLDDLVAAGLEELGQIDIAVANAGVLTVGDICALSEDEWSIVLDVNAGGVWRTVKAVVPHMKERERGSIILISSLAGLQGLERMAHYAASKHAVSGLMKCVALEFGAFNIRCNTVCPGVIDTAMINWQGAYDHAAGGEGLGSREKLLPSVRSFTLLKDRGPLPPQATSNAVLWLASDESAEVTGLEMVVDSGHMAMPGLNGAAFASNLLSDTQD